MSLNMLINVNRFKKEQKLPKKGFTLVEVLIAAVIFAFVMSGILLMFINCAFLDQANRNKSIATIHAEFVLEDIMGYMRDGGDLDGLQEKIDPALGGKGDWDLNSVRIDSECSTVINDSEEIETSYNEYEPANPLEVTVRVSWKDRVQAKTRSLELKTLIAKR